MAKEEDASRDDKYKKGGKKRKEAPPEAAAPSEPPVDASLARLRADSAFFDRLVSLVPAAFYLTGDKPGEGEPDVRFKHGAGEKASAKLRAKEGSKKAKRLKLDPANARSTVELQIEQSQAARRLQRAGGAAAAAESEEEDGEGEAEEPAGPHPDLPAWQLSSPSGSTMAELQARLALKIEQARARRRADEQAKRQENAKSWKQSVVAKRSSAGAEAAAAAKGKGGSVASPPPSSQVASPLPSGVRPAPSPAAAPIPAAHSLQFGRFAGVEVGGGRREKKAKKSREEALAAVEARQAAITQAGGAETEEGAELLSKQSWGAALARAAGDKVLDDPKLLRKSIKRANALKSSRQAAWAERTAKTSERMEERQTKRKEHLAHRTEEKMEKKRERREAKLLRPGFEGRKGSEFLNPSKGAAA